MLIHLHVVLVTATILNVAGYGHSSAGLDQLITDPCRGVQLLTSAGADVTLTYEVEGMKCDGCSSAIIAKVKKVAGVVDCTVDRTTKLATITVKNESSRADVEAAITKLGYTITKKS